MRGVIVSYSYCQDYKNSLRVSNGVFLFVNIYISTASHLILVSKMKYFYANSTRTIKRSLYLITGGENVDSLFLLFKILANFTQTCESKMRGAELLKITIIP